MNVLLVGCGNLGHALLKRWSSEKLFHDIVVIQPSLSYKEAFQNDPTIQFVADKPSIPEDFIPEMTVLAIKPQILSEVVRQLADLVKDSLIVSLAAGITLEKLTHLLPLSSKVTRIMPNMAMKVGESVNLAFANQMMMPLDCECVHQKFAPSGKIVWLKNEALLDTLTPLSGSGPAYFFLLAKIMVEESLKLGVTEDVARTLVQQVLIGSAQLAVETNDFNALTCAVASKGGVTEAALNVMAPAFTKIMEEAFQNALQRVGELSNENRC